MQHFRLYPKGLLHLQLREIKCQKHKSLLEMAEYLVALLGRISSNLICNHLVTIKFIRYLHAKLFFGDNPHNPHNPQQPAWVGRVFCLRKWVMMGCAGRVGFAKPSQKARIMFVLSRP
jgi:hypothetical protein